MARDRLPWFRIGCLGILFVPILAVLLLVVVARLTPPGESVTRELVREIPVAAVAVSNATFDGANNAFAARAAPGRVRLDFSGAEVVVKPVPAGSPITVQAVYEDASAELREAFEPSSEQGWTYEVRLHVDPGSLTGLFSSLFAGSGAKVVVSLPLDTPLALELAFARGGSRVELGGLWLTTVEVTAQQGGLELYVSEPLAEPLQRFTSSGSMGGTRYRSLGNASPRVMVVDQRMGGFELDLRGQWVQDADVDISLSMGGGAVRLPNDVVITGLADEEIESPRDGRADLPVLTISASVEFGELETIPY